MKITFHPDSDTKQFIKAASEYQSIWDNEGQRIIEAIEKFTNLKFIENYINAVVFEGRSYSHPLSLRASYSLDTKKATIVHELIHRILVGNNIQMKEQTPLETHKLVDLVLYDIWVNLYNEDFAKEQVEIESQRVDFYKQAWDFALSFTSTERAVKFKEITGRSN